MSCTRLRRELVEYFRFGGLDIRTAPHLDHLAECRDCRDEVGIDRVLVQRLRVALAERVAGATPPAASWSSILARAQAPEPGFRRWLREHAHAVVGRLRIATGGIALVMLVVIGADGAVRQGDPVATPGAVATATDFHAPQSSIRVAGTRTRPAVREAGVARSGGARRVEAQVANAPVSGSLPATPGFQVNLDPRGLALASAETNPEPAEESTDETLPTELADPPTQPSPAELAR